ncbi:MAG: PadR family transcriptional regulator [Gammaproteobacteria bacterium]|nr:PadR family transcriptional regulator [Gammaproteobacteria bacterium]
MQDKIILGMLSLQPMSVYELKKNMDKSTSMFYNTSIGSIHPACQKLLAAGLVECEEDIESKRAKKTFSITPQGRKVYREWLESPLGIGKIKDELLLRLFFFADSDDKWKEVLQSYLKDVRSMRMELEQQKAAVDRNAIPQVFQRAAHFQLATLDLGCDYYEFLENWLVKFMEQKVP